MGGNTPDITTRRFIMKRGKKYVEAAKNIDRQTLYEAADAISLVKKNATAKFDETIEAHIRTGCDGRHAEQQIRGAVVLPHGTGKTKKVLVFAKGDTNYDVDNLYQVSQNYSAMACFRNYFSFGRSHRFGMFNEVQMQFGGGQSKILNGSGDDLTGTYSKSWNMNIGLAPGLVMFLNNYSAVEVNVGLLGFNYSHTKSTTDQIYDAKVDNKNANFKINLFSITFGVTFYL